jgi:hypothetical protein
MNKISSIEWFSVEEKHPPLGVKLLLATEAMIDFGWAGGWPGKNEVYFLNFDCTFRNDVVRYWASIPPYPGPAEEAKVHWLSGHDVYVGPYQKFSSPPMINLAVPPFRSAAETEKK